MDGESNLGHRFDLRIAASRRGGLGVFALERIPSGEVIERCPILLLRETALELADHVVRVRSSIEFPTALPLGFGALYNHSSAPNAVWLVERLQRTMTVVAHETIEASDEVLIHYGRAWFTARGLQEVD